MLFLFICFNEWLLTFFLIVTETTGSLSGVSITSELNEELNDLIQHFHNQLRDSQVSVILYAVILMAALHYFGVLDLKSLMKAVLLRL